MTTSAADRARFQAAERIARDAEDRAREAGVDAKRARTLARQAGYGALIALETGADERTARENALRVIPDTSGQPRERVPQQPSQAVQRPDRKQVREAASGMPLLVFSGIAGGLIYWILSRYA